MRDDTIPVPGAADRAVAYGDLTDDLLRTDWWTDEMLARADIPVVDIPFVSIGGGIGSFVTVDYLRICGVPTSAIRVFTAIALNSVPTATRPIAASSAMPPSARMPLPSSRL